jgi:DNA-binding transcriptional LysR family regulator
MGNTISVIQAIKGGAGVSILSTVAVSEDLAAGRLAALQVAGVDLKRSFYLTRLKNRSLSPIGQAFIAFLKHTLGKDRPAI